MENTDDDSGPRGPKRGHCRCKTWTNRDRDGILHIDVERTTQERRGQLPLQTGIRERTDMDGKSLDS